jgi:RNA polymerase sigma-70 factor (family 1)
LKQDPHSNEAKLLFKIANGDEASFAELFDYYYGYLTDFVVRYVKSEELAQDIAQEIFIKIWNQKERLLEVQTFNAYLFIAARNHTFNVLKAAGKNEALKSKIAEHYHRTATDPEDASLKEEYQAFLEKKMNELPERSRQIFRLCKLEGKSYDEVAAELGISRNAVKNHIVFSKKYLKEEVKRKYGVSLGVFLAIVTGMQNFI